MDGLTVRVDAYGAPGGQWAIAEFSAGMSYMDEPHEAVVQLTTGLTALVAGLAAIFMLVALANRRRDLSRARGVEPLEGQDG